MKKFLIEIVTPDKTFYRGEAESLSLPTLAGSVAVMALHQPMVFALEPGIIEIRENGEMREAFISEGFAEVRPDETIILAQAAEWPEDIDESKALAAKERAEDMLRRQKSAQEYKLNKAALKRAFARLSVRSRHTKF